MPQENLNDLDWLAFCYIADELSGEEREQFELRLGRDQNAREAVVAAMENAQRLHLALELDSQDSENSALRETAANYRIGRRSRDSKSWRQTFLPWAAVCLLVLTIGWTWHSHSSFRQGQDQLATMPENLDEATAWASLLVEAEPRAFDSLAAEGIAYTDVVFEDNEDWMSAALSELQRGDDPLLDLGEN
jgi:hypothetical protein